MRVPRNPRERLLASRIDRKAQQILGLRQRWRAGILEFLNPYEDLTAQEEAFITKRILGWESEIIRRNGRETIH